MSAPRVLYYSHDAFGLGHIQRTLTIARELARRRPDVVQCALTSALRDELGALPPNCDAVRLPPFTHADFGAAATSASGWRGVFARREALIQATFDDFAPDLVLVDDAPAGIERELVRALACQRGADHPPRIVLGLKGVVDAPNPQRAYWTRDGVYDLLRGAYDHVLIYGSPEVYDTAREYAFPPELLDKTTYVGYVARPCRTTTAEAQALRAALGANDLPLVVVAPGGGADGGGDIRAYCDALRSGALPEVVSFVVAGPLMEGELLARLERAAARLPRMTFAPSVADLPRYFSAADLVVCKAGYNTLSEVLSLGKRALVIPRISRIQEQALHAHLLAERGLIRLAPLGRLTPERLGAAIRAALSAPPPTPMLEVGGLQRVGAMLEAWLP